MQRETFWIGEFELTGYPLTVISRTKRGAQNALFAEYRKHRRDTDFQTWADFADYFGPWIRRAKLDTVIWP